MQHISEPTHNRGHTLDLLISKDLNISNIAVTDIALSDHFCISFDSNILANIPNQSKITVRKRFLKENSAEYFKLMYTSTLFKSPTSTNTHSVNKLTDDFLSKILDMMDKIAPFKVKTVSSKKKSPWRSDPLVCNEKRECRRAERKWRKTRLQVHCEIYKERLNKYQLALKDARESFFSEIIHINNNNARTLFATVERLTSPPVAIAPELSSTRACNEFANFFIEKILKIRRSIGTLVSTPIPTLSPISTYAEKMTHFQTINQSSLDKIIENLSSATCCLDILPTGFLKKVLPAIREDLIQIVNASILSGVFPKALKTAVIKPILKKKNLDSTLMQNYRPISNLPFIGKVIEKAVFQQLNSFLTKNNRFDIYQSGFRRHHSTETALVKVFNDIRINTDRGKSTVLVLLDLSAAFDTVDHDILLERLESWGGLSGTALNWFKSYLTNRNFYVSISQFSSQNIEITCGVTQGSILGPLLFSIYMLPLSQIITTNNINYHNYADDTQLYISM
uniref:Reverse transcriptase domain-containing protein n=1 Tax=Oreochromis niloticus TaxID=8128 RepID=A0A669CVV3_ORENI